MKKIIIIFFLIFCSRITIKSENNIINDNSGDVVENSDIEIVKHAKSAILIESRTNKIIYQKDANKRMYPASMTKIMTMILVMEAIKENKITLDTIVIGSKNASKQPGSSIFLSENEKISVRDLLKGVCIASGNDASYQLAEKVSGTESLFVKEMNNKVKELNLKNTNFMNTTGLPDKGHYSSAFDIITMSSYLINNYPEILEYTKIYEDYLRKDSDKPFWLVNTNKLVKSHPDIDGLKSGVLVD